MSRQNDTPALPGIFITTYKDPDATPESHAKWKKKHAIPHDHLVIDPSMSVDGLVIDENTEISMSFLAKRNPHCLALKMRLEMSIAGEHEELGSW